MGWIAVICIVDALVAAGIGIAPLVREKRSVASISFAAVMLLLAVEAFANAFCLQTISPVEIVYWNRLAIAASAGLPIAWLAFSLT